MNAAKKKKPGFVCQLMIDVARERGVKAVSEVTTPEKLFHLALAAADELLLDEDKDRIVFTLRKRKL